MNRVTLSAVVWEEPGGFVSQCPELGVASCGESITESLAMLREAVDLYLVNAAALGITPDFTDALQASQRYTTTLDVVLPWAS
jgi:predicted RNase H-like HicB family nuclease